MKFRADGHLEELYHGEDSGPYKVIESGDWIDDGKYSYSDVIFEFEGKNYRLNKSRSGSYHSDYYYDKDDWGEEVECDEVTKEVVITHEWKVKK
jgi:hypothetical protein